MEVNEIVDSTSWCSNLGEIGKVFKMPDIESYIKKMGYTGERIGVNASEAGVALRKVLNEMAEDKMESNKNEVTVYTAYVGMKVRLKYRISSLLEADKIGEIIQISGKYGGAELHSHQCVVRFEGLKSPLTLNIGYNNKFDLIFNSKTKEDGTKRSNDKHTQKSIKVQRFNSKIREGNRERGFIVQCRTSRAKCEGYDIQNKESIIKSKKSIKYIA